VIVLGVGLYPVLASGSTLGPYLGLAQVQCRCLLGFPLELGCWALVQCRCWLGSLLVLGGFALLCDWGLAQGLGGECVPLGLPWVLGCSSFPMHHTRGKGCL
jgi:hypothetical protein